MKILLNIIWIVVLLLAGCGGDSDKQDDSLSPGEFTASSFLPGRLSGISLQTMTVLKTRARVTEYVGALADSYFEYHLVGMAAAVYEASGTKLSTEIAQFETETDAYGFYARIRPDHARLVKLGTEAYVDGNSLYFTQSTFAITLSAVGDDTTAGDLLNRLAVTISADMGAAGTIPREFALFPREKQIRASFRYVPSAYLGIERVDRVFTCRYAFAADTLTLFFTRDEQGVAYLAAGEFFAVNDDASAPVKDLGFDEDYAIALDHPEYGSIVAGLAGGYFVGGYNFNEARHGKFLKDWLAGLAAQ